MFRNGIPAVALLLAAWVPAGAEEEYSKAIRPLLKQYCLTCHSTSQKIGELDLERFSDGAEVRQGPAGLAPGRQYGRIRPDAPRGVASAERRRAPANSSNGRGGCWRPRRDPEPEIPAGWCFAA